MSLIMILGLLFPIVGALLCGFIQNPRLAKSVANGSSLFSTFIWFLLGFFLINTDATTSIELKYSWIEILKAYYAFKLDGYNLLLVIAVSISFSAIILFETNRYPWKIGLFSTLLSLQFSLLGLLLSEDGLLWMFFWMASVLPTFFLVSVWGEYKDSTLPTKWILFQSLSFLCLFLGILILVSINEPKTFLLTEIYQSSWRGKTFGILGLELDLARTVYLLMFFALLFRIQFWPLDGGLVRIMEGLSSSLCVPIALAYLIVPTFAWCKIALPLFSLSPESVMRQFSPVFIGFFVALLYIVTVQLIQANDLRKLILKISLWGIFVQLASFFVLGITGIVGSTVFSAGLVLSVSALGLYFQTIEKSFGHSSIDSIRNLFNLNPRWGVVGVAVFAGVIAVPGFIHFGAVQIILSDLIHDHGFVFLSILLTLVINFGFLAYVFQRLHSTADKEEKVFTDKEKKFAPQVVQKIAIILLVVAQISVGLMLTPWTRVIQSTLEHETKQP